LGRRAHSGHVEVRWGLGNFVDAEDSWGLDRMTAGAAAHTADLEDIALLEVRSHFSDLVEVESRYIEY